MKTVTFWSTLIRLARAEAEAVKSGDKTRIEKAKQKHEEYRLLCLKADELVMSPETEG
jgi:hypothetical protein